MLNQNGQEKLLTSDVVAAGVLVQSRLAQGTWFRNLPDFEKRGRLVGFTLLSVELLLALLSNTPLVGTACLVLVPRDFTLEAEFLFASLAAEDVVSFAPDMDLTRSAGRR